MPDITAFPIPSTSIGAQAAAVRTAIDVYSTGQTYSQAQIEAIMDFQGFYVPDPDAMLYVADVESALATTIETALPSAANPKRIISDFFKAEKAAGRWSLFKQFHLPIYNNAAANAIDLVARYVGEFVGVGSVTHAAGYVQSNGTSGYFDFKNTPAELGLSMSDAYQFALAKTAFAPTNSRVIGARNAVGQDFNLTAADTLLFRAGMMSNSSGLITSSSNAMTGILTASRKSGARFVARRSSTGYNALGSITDADVGLTPTVDIYAMAGNVVGTAGSFTTNQWGAYGVGLGLTTTQNEGFTLNLKNLYEGLTGIALP